MTDYDTFEKSRHAYIERAQLANEKIDAVLQEYNFKPGDSKNPHELIGESIIRLGIQGALSAQEGGVSDKTLFTMKEDIVVNSIARGFFVADSPWVDVIDTVVSTDNKIAFTDELVTKIRITKEAADARSQEIIADYETLLSNGLVNE